MKAEDQIADRRDNRALAEFLSGEGQAPLPMLELIKQAEMAADELIDAADRATIEAVLILSARELAGPKHPRKRTDGAIGWHGWQDGVVSLAERKLRVSKPRLRRKGNNKGPPQVKSIYPFCVPVIETLQLGFSLKLRAG